MAFAPAPDHVRKSLGDLFKNERDTDEGRQQIGELQQKVEQTLQRKGEEEDEDEEGEHAYFREPGFRLDLLRLLLKQLQNYKYFNDRQIFSLMKAVTQALCKNGRFKSAFVYELASAIKRLIVLENWPRRDEELKTGLILDIFPPADKGGAVDAYVQSLQKGQKSPGGTWSFSLSIELWKLVESRQLLENTLRLLVNTQKQMFLSPNLAALVDVAVGGIRLDRKHRVRIQALKLASLLLQQCAGAVCMGPHILNLFDAAVHMLVHPLLHDDQGSMDEALNEFFKFLKHCIDYHRVVLDRKHVKRFIQKTPFFLSECVLTDLKVTVADFCRTLIKNHKIHAKQCLDLFPTLKSDRDCVQKVAEIFRDSIGFLDKQSKETIVSARPATSPHRPGGQDDPGLINLWPILHQMLTSAMEVEAIPKPPEPLGVPPAPSSGSAAKRLNFGPTGAKKKKPLFGKPTAKKPAFGQPKPFFGKKPPRTFGPKPTAQSGGGASLRASQTIEEEDQSAMDERFASLDVALRVWVLCVETLEDDSEDCMDDNLRDMSIEPTAEARAAAAEARKKRPAGGGMDMEDRKEDLGPQGTAKPPGGNFASGDQVVSRLIGRLLGWEKATTALTKKPANRDQEAIQATETAILSVFIDLCDRSPKFENALRFLVSTEIKPKPRVKFGR